MVPYECWKNRYPHIDPKTDEVVQCDLYWQVCQQPEVPNEPEAGEGSDSAADLTGILVSAGAALVLIGGTAVAVARKRGKRVVLK